MKEKFNLIHYLTDRRDQGIIVWLCNIGAEKFWNSINTGVSDRNEDIIVNRIEEMNLLLCRKQDVMILRKQPEQEYLDTLEKMGFTIPAILTPEEPDHTSPISQLVLNDGKLLDTLRSIAQEREDVFFVPYGVTFLEEEIGKRTGLKVMGGPAAISALINDKIFNRKMSEKLGLPVCRGNICNSIEEIRQTYHDLTTGAHCFEKVIIKEPNGASGKGLYIVEEKDKLESILRLIARLSRGKEECRWLVEGWYEKKADLNYQVYVSPNGDIEVFSIKQQLLRDTVYIGSKIPPDLDSNILNAYREYGRKIGGYLFSMGYTGVAGIDSIITEEDEIIPIIEVNGRFTLSTYISFLRDIFSNKKILSRYFRITSAVPLGYGEICSAMEDLGILYCTEKGEGVFLYTSGTLPNETGDSSGIFWGRAFALIVSDSWGGIEACNAKLEKLMQSMNR